MAANESTLALQRKLYTDLGLNTSDIFTSPQGFTIITRTGIEKIQYQLKIEVSYDVITAEKDFVLIKAKAKAINNDKVIETFGSALFGDYVGVEKKGKNGSTYTQNVLKGSTNSYYVAELAEKRALARAVLKMSDLYQYQVFGQDESYDDFKPVEEAKKENQEDLMAGVLNQVKKNSMAI